jgi:hypothetical protein
LVIIDSDVFMFIRSLCKKRPVCYQAEEMDKYNDLKTVS